MSEPVLSEAQYYAQQIEIAHLSRTVQDQQAEIERLQSELNDRTLAALELYDAAGDKDWTIDEWRQFGLDNPWLADCD